MEVWLQVNDHLLVNLEETAMAVWSRMRGPTAGQYATERLKECLSGAEAWPTKEELGTELKERFQPSADKD